jgi:phage-related protein
MGWLADIFVSCWEAAKLFFSTIFGWCKTGWTWLVALIWVCITAVIDLVTSVTTMITDMLTKLTELTTPNSNISQNVGDWLQVANTFAPVNEFFGILVILSALWVVGTTYRTIKSFIPTLA